MTAWDEIRAMSAAETATRVGTGRLSPEEVVRAHLEAIEGAGDLNAFITVAADAALARARAVVAGPLAGVTLVPKDMFDTAGLRTTRGSRVFRDRIPATTAVAVGALEAAGAIVIGKANQHEFAWGVTSQNPHWGDVRNPAHPDRTPGGSSGGNAAALAAGLCHLGLGTDTGGSARMPAACCGVVGLKPSRGAISTAGCFPLAPSFDTVAPMARTVADCSLAYSVLTHRPPPRPRARGLRVGLWHPLPREQLDVWQLLGAELVEVSLPEPDADPSLIMQVEAARTHRRYFPRLREEYGPNMRAKLEAAWRVPAMEYDSARRALGSWRRRIQAGSFDILVSPTLGTEIPPFEADELAIRRQLGRFTRVVNWLGWAAIAIGNLQIAGRTDEVVLGAALAWEEVAGIVA